jgi:hypothetical protein
MITATGVHRQISDMDTHNEYRYQATSFWGVGRTKGIYVRCCCEGAVAEELRRHVSHRAKGGCVNGLVLHHPAQSKVSNLH